ncbi:coiled-coil domain-containing protein 174-like isoform X2 [Physella acuta]|uniref:coiled-coil domain-containing protein 174-like isoform X2 n=1 Tax=Physella acuta TaxID=109671 RepID=UPI0027DAFEDD|nr:coiled-coil domain-containing protein 174-like isoform X2 [Physella acuta]
MAYDERKGTLISASLVELKAELFHKQEEFRLQKATNKDFIRRSKKDSLSKHSLWSTQNPGVSKRAKNDKKDITSIEDEEIYIKSRKILEEKAEIYDKITSSLNIPEDDGSDYYLVDFQKKAIDKIVETRDPTDPSEVSQKKNDMEKCEPDGFGEEWVDFTDALGRERCCMKKDLTHLLKQGEKTALEQQKTNSATPKKESGPFISDLDISDMHRNLMRQKWENEANDLLEKAQEDIHYSNIQFDEIRQHGVGFFQFSKDHVERNIELDRLKKFHKQTVDEQSRKEKIKDKRKNMMEERLAKVRQRRNLKGRTLEQKNIKLQTTEADTEKTVDVKELEKKIQKEREIQASEEKRKSYVREWDKDKNFPRKQNIVKTYLDIRREEREADFAPPSLYFDNIKCPKTTKIVSEERINKGKQSLNQSTDVNSYNKKCEEHFNKKSKQTLEKNAQNQDIIENEQMSSYLNNSACHELIASTPLNPNSNQNTMVQNLLLSDPQEVCYSGSEFWYGSNLVDWNRPSFCNVQAVENNPVYFPPSTCSSSALETHNPVDISKIPLEVGIKKSVPKMSIMDTRYVNKTDLTSESDIHFLSQTDVMPVPYMPGSFTAAKKTQSQIASVLNNSQISSGPIKYLQGGNDSKF